ncbi:MAG: glycosyltransferase [candidate division KSB1 bacterium]|nr:glycosyltransferase [candidate division KSB1 bacterium]
MPVSRAIKIIRIQSRICIGGPALHTEILSRHLSNERYQTLLISGAIDSNESSKIKDFKQKGIPVCVIPEMKRVSNPIDDIMAIYKCFKIIRKKKPNIVHTHTAKAGTVGRLAAWLAGVPLIYHTFHGHTFHSYFSKPVTAVFLLIERVLARLSTAVIAISPSQLDELVNRYHIAPKQHFRMIRLGLELEPFKNLKRRNSLKKRLGLDPDSCLLGIVGRLVPIKNIEMALKVTSQLESRYHLCVIGDGPERNTLEIRSKELGLENRVHFMGWIEDITGIYAEIDALLLTSNNEGTPVAVIEAMAASIPVIATEVGGVPDLVKHEFNGYLCASQDVVSMSGFVRDVCQDRSHTLQICENARRFVSQYYAAHRLPERYRAFVSGTNSIKYHIFFFYNLNVFIILHWGKFVYGKNIQSRDTRIQVLSWIDKIGAAPIGFIFYGINFAIINNNGETKSSYEP